MPESDTPFLTPETTFKQALTSAKAFNADLLQQAYRDEKTGKVILLFAVAQGETADQLDRFLAEVDTSSEVEAAEEAQRLAEIELTLAALPPEQRRPIERYFRFISEASIDEEISLAMQRQGFENLEDYEKALIGIGGDVTPRSLALAEIMGH